MVKKAFQCKIEELPTIGGFLVNNVQRDLSDFANYSPLFTPKYLGDIGGKADNCRKVAQTITLTKELKAVTAELAGTGASLRLVLNKLEGYLNLSSGNLDISARDFGLARVRTCISKGNVEGTAATMQALLTTVNRNLAALTAAGMKTELVMELETLTGKIDTLNVKQNELMSKRSRLSSENIAVFNDLWNDLQTILKTARALYKGVDDVKMKDYTMTHLRKRVNVEK